MRLDSSEETADWWVVIKDTESDAQYDDYFERQDLGQIIYLGIYSMNLEVKPRSKRAQQRKDHSSLCTNVPDYNGSQIQLDRIEVER